MKRKNERDDETVAVVVVDVQGDFTEAKNGSLAVPGTGHEYVELVAEAIRKLREAGFLIVGTQDWHPGDHISFYSSHPGKAPGDIVSVDGRTQMLWPPHCVQDTENALILLDNDLVHMFVRKGARPGFDSYSAFRDDGGDETELDGILQTHRVRKVVTFGLATEYCVKFTVMDGLAKGYNVIAIESLCRGITPSGASSAIKEMERAGAVILKSLDIDKIRTL